MRSSLEFRIDLVREIAEQVKRRARSLIESRTLKRALDSRIVTNGTTYVGAEVFIPHYWAVYYHDGRGPVRPVNGKFLVYFARIEDDPRVAGGRDYPQRASQIRRLRLDPAEFRRLVKEGKLIVKRSVGPVQGKRFFERIGGRTMKSVGSRALREFRRYAKQDALVDVLRLRRTIRIRPF